MIDRSTLTAPFLISAGSLILAGGALLIGGYAFISTAVASASGDADPAQLVATWLERHDEKMDVYQARFNDRSVFYTPSPTPRPVVVAPPPPVDDTPAPCVPPVDTGPPPPPASYSGPQILAILGDEIWIRGSGANSIVRVTAGEEHQGVKLIETIPPWTAKVAWSRGEYEVALFGNSVPGISTDAPANTTASIPGIYNEGEIDPASLTRGISISPASFTPARAASSSSNGRNVARPSGMSERGSRAGRSGRSGSRRDVTSERDNAGRDATKEEMTDTQRKQQYLREQEQKTRDSQGDDRRN